MESYDVLLFDVMVGASPPVYTRVDQSWMTGCDLSLTEIANQAPEY